MSITTKTNEVDIDICYCDEVQGFLRQLREECGMNLTHAAEWQNMDMGNLSRYEHGVQDICTKTFVRLVNRYHQRLGRPLLAQNHFSVMLKKFRESRGCTRRDLSDMLNVNESVVIRFETHGNMLLKSFIRGCFALGITNLTIV